MKRPYACEVFGDKGAAATQVDQPNLRPVADDDIAIAPLQGGTGDDPGPAFRALAIDPGGHCFEPGLAVGVGQSNAGVHFRDIGLRMEPIAFLRRPAKACGKLFRHGALARTQHAHDDQDRRGAAMRTRALQAMDAGRIGNEDRLGPTDEQPLSTTPTTRLIRSSRRVGSAIDPKSQHCRPSNRFGGAA
jgi:hypothetical protein